MRNGIRAFALITAVALLAVPAVATADEYPNGCVDCHKVTDKGHGWPFAGDFRLGPLLEQTGHRWVKKIKTVPDDCTKCHSSEDDLPLATIVHLVHFEKPAANVYTTEFGGKCGSCHGMDGPAGKAMVKSGPRNW